MPRKRVAKVRVEMIKEKSVYCKTQVLDTPERAAEFARSLYYEMTGDFEKAKAFLDVASQLVKPESPDVQLIRNYRTELNVYERKYQQLQLQMNRFEEK